MVNRTLLPSGHVDGLLRLYPAARVRPGVDVREQDRLQPRLAAHAAAAARWLPALEPLAAHRQVQVPEEDRLHAALTLSSGTALASPSTSPSRRNSIRVLSALLHLDAVI